MAEVEFGCKIIENKGKKDVNLSCIIKEGSKKIGTLEIDSKEKTFNLKLDKSLIEQLQKK